MKLRHKLFLILLVSLSTMYMISLAVNHAIIKRYNRLLTTEITKNMELSSKSILEITRNIQYHANQLSNNKEIQAYLRKRKNRQNTPSDYTQIYNLISGMYFDSNTRPYMKYVNIMDHDFAIGTYTGMLEPISFQNRAELIEYAKPFNGSCSFYTNPDVTPDPLCLKSIREINMLTLDNLGTVVIGLDLKKILTYALPSSDYDGAIQLLTTREQGLIYTSMDSFPVTETLLNQILANSWSVVDVDKSSYLQVSMDLAETNWHYTVLVPYDPITSIQILYITVFSAVLGSFLLVLFLVSTKIIRIMFRNFDYLMVNMKNGKVEFNLSDQIKGEMSARSDEIGDLYRQFSHMAEQINQLIYDNYTIQLKTKDYQIKALSAQISPHFLYNTLDSINWKAKSANVVYISEMVESLGKILQLTLNNTSYFFTLDEEVMIVQYYLNIQILRYKEKLTYRFQVDPSIGDCLVPRLILQPIIENAIQEAMGYLDGSCHLGICLGQRDSRIQIQISNTGSSFEEDFNSRFETGSVSPHGFGIGLKNIEQRLSLCYEDDFSFRFYNAQDKAVVEILVPLKRKEEMDLA